MAYRQEYSTLEVNHSHAAPEVYHDPDYHQKEALATAHSLPGAQYPEVAPNQYGSAYNGQSYTTPSTMYSATTPGTTKSHAEYHTYGEAPEAVDGHDGSSRKKTICGLVPQNFYIILAVIVIVILGAVGGGVGGALASQSKESPAKTTETVSDGLDGAEGNGTSTTPAGPKLLGITKITAANWTDANGNAHRNVFFQDEFNSIIERRWDSESNKWATSNITKLFEASTTFGPQYGTSLSVAAMDQGGTDGYELQLYFLDDWNFIRSVHAKDPAVKPENWVNNTLDGAYLEVRRGSHLSAMYQSCWDDSCAGSWCVAYQRPSDGSIKTANSSHWTVSDVAVDGADLSNNSSMALIPRLVGQRLSGALLSSTGVASSSSAPLQISTFTDAWDGSLHPIAIQSAAPPSEQNSYTATQYNNWRNSIFLSLTPDGSLQAVWNGGSTSRMTLSNAPEGTKLTAVAFTLDSRLYGISGDEIHEYTFDGSSPSALTYVGKIWPEEQ